jgi:hypothetical protein
MDDLTDLLEKQIEYILEKYVPETLYKHEDFIENFMSGLKKEEEIYLLTDEDLEINI